MTSLNEEMYNNSRGNSYYDENECNNDSDFLGCYTNGSGSISSSCHLDNNHSQEDNIFEEVFLSPNEISDFLAHDFDKYVSTSNNVFIFPHNVLSFSQVTSPMFDMEKDTKSKNYLYQALEVQMIVPQMYMHMTT